MGYNMLRNGFRQCCRQIIGLDGTFLKPVTGGALLATIGKDNDNRMFPIAWVVVEGQNQRSWTWFLEILYFKICSFQMDLVGPSSQTNKKYALILFYFIISLSCNEG